MIFPTIWLLTHAASCNFSKLVFFVKSNFYVFKCQQFLHSSIPETYTLGARRTHNQIDSNVTFFQIVQSSKDHRNELKGNNYGRIIDFLIQISKPSYFTLLCLADLSMHH